MPLPPGRQHEISLLAGELRDYVTAVEQGEASWRDLFAEAGILCPRCQSLGCARFHSWWRRKRVIDLSTGEVFTNLAICRVVFCNSSTQSLWPAEVWRGKATLTSVVEAVVHVAREGIEAAWEWSRAATDQGREITSRRTLRRWKAAVERRLIPSATSWLREVEWPGSSPAEQLEQLLEELSADHLLSFRAATGRAMLDKTARHDESPAADRATRPVPGRLDPSAPHETPRPRRPRGSWSARSARGSPRSRFLEDPRHD